MFFLLWVWQRPGPKQKQKFCINTVFQQTADFFCVPTLFERSKPAVPNLGYAYPHGYVRNLKRYAKWHQLKIYSKILTENVLICLLIMNLGVHYIYVYCLSRKRSGTAGLNHCKVYLLHVVFASTYYNALHFWRNCIDNSQSYLANLIIATSAKLSKIISRWSFILT